MRISDWSSDVCSSDLLAEAVAAEQGMHHVQDLGPLFIDGRRIEIVDLDVGVGAYRMGERAVVLRELARPQEPHVGDPLDRVRAHVGGERLVAEHGQPFLRSEEHTSELQSLMRISYAVFCLKKKIISIPK